MSAGIPGNLAVGIDVGGTSIRAGLVDRRDGRILAERRVTTPVAEGGAAVLRRCRTLAEDVLRDAPAGTHRIAIGIAICELVDLDGNVTSAHSVDWRSLDPAGAFADLGPVALESDVRAVALAETRFGAARGARSALVVVIGTGIASCFVLDGVLHRGAHGAALVLGSRPPAAGVAPLESVASGAAIAMLTRLPTARDAFEAADQGDAPTREIVLLAIEALGVAVAHLVNVFDPDVVVLAGGIGSEPVIASRIARVARPAIYAPAAATVPILPSPFGDRSGVIGAALAAPSTFADDRATSAPRTPQPSARGT